MGDYDPYLKWASDNKTWVSALDVLRNNEYGFSFTRKLERPSPKVPAIYSGDSHLARYRRAEHADLLAWYDGDYQLLWTTYQSGLGKYLSIGEAFLRQVTDPAVNLTRKHDLMVDGQRYGHLMHNAAVLWLEQPGNAVADLGDRQDYEEVLKVLWVGELRSAHPEWMARRPTARHTALLTYCLGRGDLDDIPRWDSQRLAAIKTASHVTLGKVLQRGTRLPTGRWQHPSYWGLFLISPLHARDVGTYQPAAGEPETRWIQHLSSDLGMRDPLFRGGSNGLDVYEKVPRPPADPRYATPGVYLHRSKAHGRDDFLTVIPAPDGSAPIAPLVFCTKGVGADPDQIGSSTARDLDFVRQFASRWRGGARTDLPFAYPADTDGDGDGVDGDAKRAGSWRNIGFCVAYARAGEDAEMATADFAHFGVMHAQATLHPLAKDGHGFVQPIATVEINCLPRTRARMLDVVRAVDSGRIGYPVQVVTVSPVETSLRLTKENSQQDYVYGDLRLEIAEWERCYPAGLLPAAVIKAVEADLAVLREDLTAQLGLPADVQGVLIDSLRRRMLVALSVVRRALASWQIFLDHGWASDTYTGSFSGRNFNSGPRDSNEWGDLDRPSERQELGAPAGEGMLAAHVDIGNLLGLLAAKGDVMRTLELVPPDGGRPNRLDGKSLSGEYLDATWVWKESTVGRITDAVSQVLVTVRNQLTEALGPEWLALPADKRREDTLATIQKCLVKAAATATTGTEPARPEDAYRQTLKALLPWW